MEFFKKTTRFDFIGMRRATLIGSLIVNFILIGSLIFQGLNLGLDFTGGVLLEVGYEQPVALDDIRTTLAKEGFHGATVQNFGTTRDVLIRLPPRKGVQESTLSDAVLQALKQNSTAGEVNLRRVEFVGPQVGDELVEQGGLALLISFLFIFVYVMLRFEWRFSVGAVVATAHDILITIGLFSLFRIEFDLTVLAAILAVLGYSLNDTVVVFDRIRENFRKMRKGTTIEIMNAAINQTLSRTIMTSVVTLLVVVVLYFLGGPIIQGFALAMIIGILVGTYSSIFVASPIALVLGVDRTNLMPVKREGETNGVQP